MQLFSTLSRHMTLKAINISVFNGVVEVSFILYVRRICHLRSNQSQRKMNRCKTYNRIPSGTEKLWISSRLRSFNQWWHIQVVSLTYHDSYFVILFLVLSWEGAVVSVFENNIASFVFVWRPTTRKMLTWGYHWILGFFHVLSDEWLYPRSDPPCNS